MANKLSVSGIMCDRVVILVVLTLFGNSASIFCASYGQFSEFGSSSISEDLQDDYTDNAIDLVGTSISPLEDFLLTVSNPFRIFNRPEDQLDRNTERLILGLPSGLRDIFLTGRKFAEKGFGDVMEQHRKRIQAIFPGTLWCGTGDIARNSEDIGLFSLSDSCCRTHDSCPQYINAGGDSRGLRNSGIFARSHCACDEEFHRCLRKTHTLVSKKIGMTYFDVLQPQCFKLEYPIKRCLRYTRFPGPKRCVLYEFDKTSNKTWQWFDNRNFLIPFEF